MMKNKFAIRMTAFMAAGAMALSMCACGASTGASAQQAESTQEESASSVTEAIGTETENIAEAEEELMNVGGWEMNTGDVSLDQNKEAKEALEKATEALEGYEFEPIALLGTQVVAGTNYAILCRGEGVYPGAEPVYEIVYIYEDLDGNAEISSSQEITIGDITEDNGKETGDADTEGGMTQIANPFTDYESLEEAEAAAGFELQIPEAPQGYATVCYRVMDDSMIEVIWLSGEDEEAAEAYRVRKAAGEDDISGDYNEYAEVNTIDSDGRTITLKGNDGKVFLMTWTRDGYTYAVDIDMNGEGLSQEAAEELAGSVR